MSFILLFSLLVLILAQLGATLAYVLGHGRWTREIMAAKMLLLLATGIALWLALSADARERRMTTTLQGKDAALDLLILEREKVAALCR